MNEQLRNTTDATDESGQKIGGRFAGSAQSAPDVALDKPAELVAGQKILYQADSVTNEVAGVIVEVLSGPNLGADDERFVVRLNNIWDAGRRFTAGRQIAVTRFSLVADGTHVPGLDLNGFDKDGFYQGSGRISNDLGFKKDGRHAITGTYFDVHGFNGDHVHRTGSRYDSNGYDYRGFDEDGYNRNGFNVAGNHFDTGTPRDLDGLDAAGLDIERYDSAGINLLGFDRSGRHCVTLTQYDVVGVDADGWRENGIHVNGYDRTGHYPHQSELRHVRVPGHGHPRPTDEYVTELNPIGTYVLQTDAGFYVADRHGTFTRFDSQEHATEVAAAQLGPWN